MMAALLRCKAGPSQMVDCLGPNTYQPHKDGGILLCFLQNNAANKLVLCERHLFCAERQAEKLAILFSKTSI